MLLLFMGIKISFSTFSVQDFLFMMRTIPCLHTLYHACESRDLGTNVEWFDSCFDMVRFLASCGEEIYAE